MLFGMYDERPYFERLLCLGTGVLAKESVVIR